MAPAALKILYLADIRFPLERANGIQTMETCAALARRGHDVTLFVRPDVQRPARDPFQFYGLDAPRGMRIERAPAVGPSGLRRMMYLSQASVRALRSRGHVVLTRDLGAAAALLRWPARLRPRVVYESHGFAPIVSLGMRQMLADGRDPSNAKQRRLLRRERQVWRRADGYVTITRALAGELAGRFGARRRLATIPDGVRTIASLCDTEIHDPPLVVYCGHLYPWKGVEVLLQALTRLPHVHALIVGGHPAETDLARLRALAEGHGISRRVTFTGMVEPARVPELLARGDVLVLPNTATRISSAYTSPLKLFEYMAAGKPIVAADLPSVREILRADESAVLAAPGDPDAFAAAIRRVVDDRALAAKLAARALEDVQDYTWDRRAERIEALIRTMTT